MTKPKKKRELCPLEPGPPAEQPGPTLEDLARTEQVIRWIATGASYTEIIEQIDKTYPGTPAEKVYDSAISIIRTAGDVDPAILRGFAIESAREIYRRLMEAGDLVNALRALRMMLDLQA